MRHVGILMLCAAAAACFMAEAAPQNNGGQGPRRRRPSIAELGGIVAMAPTGRVIRVANAQKRVPADVLRTTAEVMQDALGFPVEVAESNGVEKPGGAVAAVIVVGDRGVDSPRILIAPEEGWAAVNTEALAADGAAGEKYDLRVTRELWRAFAIMLGASDSTFQPCLLAPVHSLADLDGLGCNVPAPEPFRKMARNAIALGCQRQHRATYKRACEEGWAPAPTNDVQRAIWEKVHELPAAPIKIKPETRKVAE